RWKLEPQSKITGPQVAAPQTSIAALARKPGTIEVFWIGQDGSVQHAFWNEGGAWTQGNQPRIAPAGVAAPQAGIAAVSRMPNTMEVFWIGPGDPLRHTFWYDGGVSWWDSESPIIPPRDCRAAEEPYAAYVDRVPQSAADVGTVEHAVLHLVNVERTQRGLQPLCYSRQLAAAARAHSENWALNPTRGCPPNPNWECGHWDSRPGLDWPEKRFAASGYGPITLGENTQWGVGTSDGTNVVPAGWAWGTARSAVYWWMNHHPENNYADNRHRAAILNPGFRDAGPGVSRYADGSGNRGATFTLMFGAR
ncbi:CAP domain-containing protein, partial [Nonomuraea sp. NPDC059194]|uniref:CAP domain-containing protein n=1 Tax=Nonomuraea sp. NPDC059194 TaxID=3346764 RepID=UPI0036A3EA97